MDKLEIVTACISKALNVKSEMVQKVAMKNNYHEVVTMNVFLFVSTDVFRETQIFTLLPKPLLSSK